MPAEAKPAHELDIEIGTPISEIRRILLVEGQPLAIVTSYLPEAHGQAPRNVDLTNPSLYDFVESESTIIVLCARLVIEAACVSETDGSLLEISPGDPVMRLESTGYTSNGRPVEYFEAYHRGDRTRLDIRPVRRGSPWRVIE